MSQRNPEHQQWVLVDFKSAQLHPGDKPNSIVLMVTGNTPTSSGSGCPVKLVPRTYVMQPEFWAIEVLWDRANAIFQSLCPFEVSLPLDGYCDTKGIEVVGHARSEQLLYQ